MARVTKQLHEDWNFSLGDVSNAQETTFNDDEWQLVNLPHDWSIKGKFTKESFEYIDMLKNIGHRIGYLPQGIGWYRKRFHVPDGDKEKVTYIQFDGVYRNATVWLNGHQLGFHPYGYTSFYFDLTPFLKFGETNVLAVRVDNFGISSRWYTGSGIYRKVTINTMEKIHVAHWGTYVTTPEVSAAAAKVRARTRIANDSGISCNVDIMTEILDKGAVVASSKESRALSPGETEIDQLIAVKKPTLWSVDNPHLYTARATISSNGDVLDVYDTVFGIRSFKFDPDKGFFLNGQSLKIKGVCLHHDNGCIGAVEHERAVARKLRILKEVGCNAIRTSHNPPSVELLDACDKEGFLVMAEAFDEWKARKTPFGYWIHFNEWYERDMTDFVRRDRNHPSIILWSVGNEVHEQTIPAGTAVCKALVDIFHAEDPTRPVTSGSNHPSDANKYGYSDLLDVVGYNYFGDRVIHMGDDGYVVEYDEEHKKYPKRCMIGSENVSNWSTRGVYRWPVGFSGQAWKLGDDFMCPAYDLISEISLLVLKTRPYVSGMFTWEGFDYIGEPTPYDWPSRSSNYGIVDLAGFPKDTYYMYQSQWTSPACKPMVHVLPHWNWETGMTVPVWVYSNCESAELVVNGKSLGTKKFAEAQDEGLLHLEWEVPYEPGEITAIAKQGTKAMATKTVRTSKAPCKIMLKADWTEIAADGNDITYITASIHDIDGNFVPTAQNLVTFTVKGPATVIGVDNGNPISHEPFFEDQIHAFNGLCLAVVQSEDHAGSITVTASSLGLKSDAVTINAKK
nr:glycoside hydrolase family 2 TIM barrel-domain containing protein [Candidatus Sigynarchaeota archaeon]